MEDNLICNICKQSVLISWNYCPNCGNVLHERPPSTSLGRQLLIYSVSFFLPPLGLGYAFKYLKQKEAKSKAVGIAAVILTVISLVMLIAGFKIIMDYYSSLLNSLEI